MLCIEATKPNSRELAHHEWDPLVLAAGYQYVAFDGLNRWYVADEHAELAPAVRQPYNVLDQMLDGWRRRYEVQLEQWVVQLQAAAATAERERDSMAAQVRSLSQQLKAHRRRA